MISDSDRDHYETMSKSDLVTNLARLNRQVQDLMADYKRLSGVRALILKELKKR